MCLSLLKGIATHCELSSRPNISFPWSTMRSMRINMRQVCPSARAVGLGTTPVWCCGWDQFIFARFRKHVEYRPQKKAVISVSLEAGGTAEVAARSHSERSERLVKAFWRHVPIQSHQIYASAQCMSITWLNSLLNSYCGSRANTIKYDQIRTLSPLGGRKRINALNESKQPCPFCPQRIAGRVSIRAM